MKKGDLSIGAIANVLIAAFVILLVFTIPGKGSIDKGGKQIDTAASSANNTAKSFSCTTFCGTYIDKSSDEKQKALCRLCDTNGKKRYECNTGVAGQCEERQTSVCGGGEPAVEVNCLAYLKEISSRPEIQPPSGGAASDKRIVLEKDGKPVTGITYGEFTARLQKTDGTYLPNPASITLKLSDGTGDVSKKCGVSKNLDCFNPASDALSNNPFNFPANPLPNGRYNLYIKADTAEATWAADWQCPKIKLEGTLGAGSEVTAEFETAVSDINKVTIDVNGNSVTDKTKTADTKARAKFVLPKLGTVKEGDNKLTIVRNDDGGICITDNAVKNKLEESFGWACPQTGCYKEGAGTYYQLKTKQNGGGDVDYETGCSYAEKDGPACAHGCTGGRCRMPDLKIISVKLDAKDGKEIGDEPIYDIDSDRLIFVRVKNIGTSNAYDVGATEMKFGTAAMINFGVETGDTTITPGEEEVYKFGIPKESSDIGAFYENAEKQVSIVFGGSDVDNGEKADANPADNAYPKSIKIYNTCFAPCEYYKSGSTMNKAKAKTLCNSCSGSVCPTCHKCQWDTPTDACKAKS